MSITPEQLAADEAICTPNMTVRLELAPLFRRLARAIWPGPQAAGVNYLNRASEAFPHYIAEVRRLNAELAAARAESMKFRDALKAIAESPHCLYRQGDAGGEYDTGVADGHRCAANMARAALGKEPA